MVRRITTEEFKERLNNIYGNQFELLEDYVNGSTKIKLKCNYCGNVIFKRPNKMISKTHEGCYICSGKNWFKDKSYFQNEVNEKYPNQYLIIGDYVKAREPLLVKRLKCGHEYKVSPDNLLRGRGCPSCRVSSTYTVYTEKIFNKLGIQFEREKTFDGCVSNEQRKLRFDYYLKDYNCCVEVDGEYHFAPTRYKDGVEKYNKLVECDNIKNDFCKTHNIDLLRLPYYEIDDFEELIKNKLHVNTEVTNTK